MRTISLCLALLWCASSSWAQAGRPLTAEEMKALGSIIPPLQPGQEVRILIEHESASGAGVGVNHTGGKLEGKYDHTAPTTNLSGGTGATGGGGSGEFKITSGGGILAIRLLLGLGGLGAIGYGGLLAKRGSIGHAATAGLIGAGLLAAAVFPALLIPLVCGAAILAVVAHGAGAVSAKSSREALRALMEGVSEQPDDLRAKIMERTRTAADPGDLRTIAAVAENDALKMGA